MLGKIEAVSDYIFVYQEDVASDRTRVSIDVKDADIREVLGKILPESINYRLSGRQILLHRDDTSAPPQQAGNGLTEASEATYSKGHGH